MGEASSIARAGIRRRLFRVGTSPLALALVWVLAVIPLRPDIVSPANLRDVTLSAMPLLVLTVGQLFVLVVAGIDLSVAAVVGLASVVGAMAMAHDPSPAVGIAAMLGVGLGMGFLHGISVAVLRMPAFLVTMSTLVAGGGAAVWLTEGRPAAGVPEAFVRAAGGAWLGVPVAAWVAAVVAGVAYFLLARTVRGRQLYAVGLNPEAARVSGVPVARRVAFAFAASALCSAAAGALYTARLEAGSPTLLPREILLDVLGAAVIGGASLRGGRGTVPGVVAGVAVMALIGNGLTMLDLDYWHVVMAKGGLIFLAAALDALRNRGGRSP